MAQRTVVKSNWWRADYPCRCSCTPVRTKATPSPIQLFLHQALESCDLFDLLPFVEWRVLWVGAITASDGTLSNKRLYLKIQHSTTAHHLPPFAAARSCSCFLSEPAVLHQIAWRFRLASRRRRPARTMHVHMQPLQPPASHRLRSFRCTRDDASSKFS